MKKGRRRILSLVLALALAVGSASVPSVTAEAAKNVKVKKIQITNPKKKTVTLNKGKTLQLKIKVTPKNAKNKKVTYKSSNKKIASVTSKGKIKGIKKGTATITVTAKDKSKKKAKLKVKVVTPVSKVKLNASSKTITVGKTVKLKATVTPKNAYNKKVKWKTSNKKTATVSTKGVVKGIKAGTATITATAADGSKKKASCKVTVKAKSTPVPSPSPNPDPGPNPPASAALSGLAVTKAPAKTAYLAGDTFDPSGMEVTASYSDKTTKVIDAKAYTYAPNTALKLTDKQIVITYKEGDVAKTAVTPITVSERTTNAALKNIAVTALPAKEDYWAGEKFDPAGMEVTASYEDGSTKILKTEEYTLAPDTNTELKITDTQVTITYQEGGITKTASVAITVSERPDVMLKSIKVTKNPDKTEYFEGEKFDPSGMTVTASYSDNSTKEISAEQYTLTPDKDTPLQLTDTKITINYKEGAAKVSTEISITVKAAEASPLQKIEVTKQPAKTEYQEGETFDPAGMEVTATYENGAKKAVTNYTYEKTALDPAKQKVKITYTEGGITKETEVSITVIAANKLESISYELKKTELEREGACFTDDDITITAVFENGDTKVISVADCTVEPAVFTKDTTEAEVSYTYGQRTRSVKVTGFTVKQYREVYTFDDKNTVGTIVKRANETVNAVPTEDNAKDVALVFENGLNGKALKMDGTYGVRLDKIAGTESKSYSISMWVKPDSLNLNQALLISTANKFGLEKDENNQQLPETWCAVAGSNNTGGIKLWSLGPNSDGKHSETAFSNIPLGENAGWSHVVLVVDGTAAAEGTEAKEGRALGTLYVNGRKAGSGNVQNDKGTNMKTYLGVTGWTPDGYYSGLIDELTFTNEVLTQDEIEQLYLAYSADKEIAMVTADQGIEVEYGTSLADVKRALAKAVIKGVSGETEVPFTNSEELWSLEDYTVTTEQEVTATAKLPAPDGYVFKTGDKTSLWKTISVEVKIKEPIIITQVSPSDGAMEVEYGTSAEEILEKLAALTLTAVTSDNEPYQIANRASLWTLEQTETGYTASLALPRAKVGYKYADNIPKVTVAITEKQPIVITGLSVSSNTLTVLNNTSLNAVKTELAALDLTASVETGNTPPSIDNTEELWAVEGYQSTTAGTYTASALISAPAGYKFAENISGKLTVEVTVQAPSTEKTLASIEITKQPDKTVYVVGHTFHKAGMTVQANYANGVTEDVTASISVDESAALARGQKTVAVSYTEGSITKTASCSISVVELEQGATAYYKFDGNLKNEITGENAATANLVQTGTGTSSFEENGVKDGYLKLGSDTGEGIKLDTGINSKDYSISVWVRADQLNHNYSPVIYGVNEGYELIWYSCYGAADKFTIRTVDGSYGDGRDVEFEPMTNVLEQGTWKMLTLTMEGASGKFYLDGEKIAEKELKNLYETRPAELYLGICKFDFTYEGAYDELSVYDFALSDSEVKDLYGRVKPVISDISVNADPEKFTFLKSEVEKDQSKIQTALKELNINVSMKHGTAPQFDNNTDWKLTAKEDGSGYTASKVLTVPTGYELDENVKTTLKVDVIVKDVTLSSIAVTASPAKTQYLVGEKFDQTGMEVTASYSDNSTKKVTGYTIDSKDQALAKPESGDTVAITIKYTEGGVEQTAVQNITVLTLEEAMNKARTAHYTFDGKLTDEISSAGAVIVKNKPAANNNAAGESAADYVEGKSGKAIHFSGDGTHDGLKLDASITSSDYTISMWVKPEAQTAQYASSLYAWKDTAHYLAWYSGHTTNQSDAGTENGFMGMEMSGRKDTEEITGLYKVNEWAMITYVVSGANTKVYRNGTLVKEAVQHADLFKEGGYTFYLGSGGNWDHSFNGAWDEVSFFNTALTEEQIQILYREVESAQTAE